jgi:similar to stage IV sporulation protein
VILFLYRFLCGYLYLRVKAKNPEKLLNLCAAKGISIWRVSVKKDTLYFKIGIHSFKKLRVYKRRIPCKIHITKKVGLPFFVLKNKKRYGMPVGIALFIAIIYFMSGSVWNICISGNKNVKSSDIMSSLNEIGIYEGAFIKNIDPEEKRNELLLKQSGLSWAAINIEGSKITVDVSETKQSEKNDNSPSNLIANAEGIIKKIEAKNGVIKAKVGDAVRKGQLLVSGIREFEDGSEQFVRSKGNVFAEVEYSFETVQPLKVTEFIKTGEVLERKVLNFFGLKIPLFIGGVEGPFITSLKTEKISSGEAYLPIKIISKKFYKTKETTYRLNEQQAKQRAEKAAEEKAKTLTNNGEIIAKNHQVIVEKEAVIIKTQIKCLKDIAFEEKILLDTSN